MQPRALIVHVAQALLLAASAVAGGSAVQQQASVATPTPVTVLHVVPTQRREVGEADPADCRTVSARNGEGHHYWLRDDAPGDDRVHGLSGS